MPTIRPATRADAPHLAQLVNIAGEGMPLTIWSGMTGPGGDVWKTGAARAARDDGGFSWRNALIAEVDGHVAAALVAYVTQPEPLDDDTPAMFRPLIELENLAPGTLYINVLATYPAFRGIGLGTALMAAAGQRCAGKAQSLIAASGNTRERALYQRLGFHDVARRPAVATDGWTTAHGAWILMRRD
ncbi:MAG: GNAT family N-acetyltransferase [Rhodobacteraceae bacterium]|nr:GNAT family N-acetyltransferase [Paracoccaceae bacterium]